jgi:hypothetical protein
MRRSSRVLDQVFGDSSGASRLRDEAARLVNAIETKFWWDSEGTYYLGLDGAKQPIKTVASNPGQLLWTGVVDPVRAALVAKRLLAEDMWSGWGIRTLSDRHVAYNPFSYQLGSVWPDDNALIAAGFRNYGLDAEAARVARGLDADAGAGTAVLRVWPALPDWLDEVRLEGLGIGTACVDLQVRRNPDGTHEVTVSNQDGDLAVVIDESGDRRIQQP